MGRKRNRIERGKTKSISQLPLKIQIIINQIKKFTDVGLYGSYLKGNWVEESDLDLGIKNVNTWRLVIKNISKYHNIKIDIRELTNHPQILRM